MAKRVPLPRPETDVEGRTRHIMRLMANLQWVGGVTNYELAERWGVSPSTVKDYSAEASRRLRAEGPEEAELRLQLKQGAVARAAKMALLADEAAGSAKSKRDLRGIAAVERVGAEMLKLVLIEGTRGAREDDNERRQLAGMGRKELLKAALSGMTKEEVMELLDG